MKEGIFIGAHIRSVLHDDGFEPYFSADELAVWKAFK